MSTWNHLDHLDHPELSISLPTQGVIAITVKNPSIFDSWAKNVTDLIFVLLFAVSWFKLGSSILCLLSWSFAVFLYLYSKSTQVLYESVLVIARHGVQLETHRGLKVPLIPALPLTAKRRFIPFNFVRDVIINEGLLRWNVRYYLCVIRDSGSKVTLEVVFENLLPHLPVLEIIYRHIQEILYLRK